jgi:hypothetical protein
VDGAVSLAAACSTHPELRAALGRAAYHLVITPAGEVEQTTPLRYATPHAVSWNPVSVAVVLLKDEHVAATPAQVAALVEVCAVLCLAYEVPAALVTGTCPQCHEVHHIAGLAGHTELPHSTRDPRKVCPELDMDAIRAAVRARLSGAVSVPGVEACGMVR